MLCVWRCACVPSVHWCGIFRGNYRLGSGSGAFVTRGCCKGFSEGFGRFALTHLCSVALMRCCEVTGMAYRPLGQHFNHAVACSPGHDCGGGGLPTPVAALYQNWVGARHAWLRCLLWTLGGNGLWWPGKGCPPRPRFCLAVCGLSDWRLWLTSGAVAGVS